MNRCRLILVIFLLCFPLFEILAQEIAEEQKEVITEPKKEREAPAIIEIKQKEPGQPLFSLELRNAPIKDFLRLLAHDYNLNILIDKDVKGEITASLRNISLEEALERIAEMHNLILEKKEDVIIVRPNLITKVFILKNLEVRELLKLPQEKEGEESRAHTIYDLLSEEGKIFLGEQQNSLVVIDYPSNIKKVEEFLQVMDQKMTFHVFKLKYLSVKELFPQLVDREIEERKKYREEREAERAEIKEIRELEEGGERK